MRVRQDGLMAFAWVVGGLASSTSAQVSSIAENFDVGLAGLTTYSDAEDLVWLPNGGNPGGAAQADDRGTGGWWGFVAPPTFFGNRSCMYGGVLSFQTKTNGISGYSNSEPDLRLEGAGLVLVYDLTIPTNNTWVARRVTLREDSGWRKSTLGGPIPTSAEFQSVLADLTSIKFRGEFSTIIDTGQLDSLLFASFVVHDPASVTVCPSAAATLTATASRPTPGTFGYRWQWRASEQDPFEDLVEGLNGSPVEFTAQGVATDSVTLSGFTDATSVSRWTLRCLVNLVGSSCDAVRSTLATITVCPADFNCDGFVDFFDFDVFVACFEGAGCPPDVDADFNGDGFVDFFDFDDFVVAFESGC